MHVVYFRHQIRYRIRVVDYGWIN